MRTINATATTTPIRIATTDVAVLELVLSDEAAWRVDTTATKGMVVVVTVVVVVVADVVDNGLESYKRAIE